MKSIITFLLLLPIAVIAQRDWSNVEIPYTEQAPGLYRLFVDNRVAVVLMVGDEGALMIDAAYEQTADSLMSRVRGITSKPIKYLINTHIHGDHTGGNKVIGKDVDIIAHSNVRRFLSTERKQDDRVIPPFPEYAQPNITFDDSMALDFNGQSIRLIHLAGGHTDGDAIIYFPKSNVLMVGDLLFAGYFPYVDVGNGGNPLRYLENIEWILSQYPTDAIVIGGHGPVFSMQQYQEYLDTLQLTIETVREAKLNGVSLQEMKENRILKEWEDFGKFFITEERWIDTIYPYL